MTVHPLTKKSLKNIGFYAPLNPSQVTGSGINLSNNINYFGGDYKFYPDINQSDIKNKYIEFISDIDNQKRKRPKKIATTLKEKNVLFSTGAVDGLDLLLRTFTEASHDRIIITPPTFSAFYHCADIYGLKKIFIELEGENLNRLSVEKIINTNAKVLLLCDPNNPISTRINSDDIKEVCYNFNGLIIIDEAYVELSIRPSSLDLIKDFNNIVILRSLSKSFGMAGLRIGAIIGDESIIESVKRVQPPFNMPTPVIHAIKSELFDTKKISKNIDRICTERSRVIDRLISSEVIDKIYPSDTNFLFIKFRDFSLAKDKLISAGIEVLWNPENIKDVARITLGYPSYNDCLIKSLV